MTRAAILCPGRGSYAKETLGSLPAGHPWVRRADELRAERGLEPLSELDAASRWDPARHLAPESASPLIWLVTMIDAARAAGEHDVVCVAGNSMGWYTALAVAGALDFDAGFRLVQEMSLLQKADAERVAGGQLLYPIAGDDWRPDPERRAAVERALAAAGGEAFPSIRLGGYAVLAGTGEGLAAAKRELPPVTVGSTRYPFRLVQHGPYHTPLVARVSEEARERLADLPFARPRVTLVDGTGRWHTPWSADPVALAAYTLGPQVTEPFDFTASVRVALREWAPDRLVVPGPGNSLGGVVGQVLVAEGWRGIRSRDDFLRVQESAEPIVVSMRR